MKDTDSRLTHNLTRRQKLTLLQACAAKLLQLSTTVCTAGAGHVCSAVCYNFHCCRAETRLGGSGEQGFLFLLPLCFQALSGPLPPLLGPLPLPLPFCFCAIALRIIGRRVHDNCAGSAALMVKQKFDVGMAMIVRLTGPKMTALEQAAHTGNHAYMKWCGSYSHRQKQTPDWQKEWSAKHSHRRLLYSCYPGHWQRGSGQSQSEQQMM